MKISTLMSGSSGNAIYISTEESNILIDAGQTGKAITQCLAAGCALLPSEIDAIFITHAHRDHIQGAGVLSRKYDLPIYATEGTWTEMEPIIGPIKQHNKCYVTDNDKVEIGDLVIEAFPLSHDALEPVGYRCEAAGKSVGIATDSGVFTTKMQEALHNVDCLVIEANHDLEMLTKGTYPWYLKKRIAGANGHLSNEDAGQAILRTIGDCTREVILAHLSKDNNRPELALSTIRDILEKNRVDLEKVNITVAPRYQSSLLLKI